MTTIKFNGVDLITKPFNFRDFGSSKITKFGQNQKLLFFLNKEMTILNLTKLRHYLSNKARKME